MVNELETEKEEVFGEKIEGINYVIREGVYGVVINEQGKIAVVKNQYGFFLPGGGIEKGETHEECLRREFIEETGYSIVIKNYIGKASKYYFAKPFDHFRHPIGWFYVVSLEKMVTNKIEEGHELLWVEPLKCSNLLFDHQYWAVQEAVSAQLKKDN